MKTAGMMLAIALLVACKGGTSVGVGGGGTGNGKDPDNIDVDGDGRNDVPLRDPDETMTGDLADGAVIDLSWADQLVSDACWPGNENANFNGNHVFFYPIDKEGHDDIFVRVTPADKDVDVSLYLMEFQDASSVQVPPDITDNSRCDAAYDQDGDSNPGYAEAYEEFGFPSRAMLIGVAGANHQASGAFTVDIWKSDSNLDSGG